MARVKSGRQRLTSALIAALLIGLGPAIRASAQSEETVGHPLAESLFKAGRELMDAQRFEEACQKFEESQRLDPSAGTLLNLGRCFEARGKTATAWSLYKQTISLGKTTNKPRHVTAAEEFLAAIEPRLARLVVTVVNPVPGLQVRRGELAIGEAARGLAVPVDPSSYVVVAEAPGFERFEAHVEVGDGMTATVVVPELTKSAARREPPPKGKRGPDPLFISGVALAGFGVVGLSVGAALGVMTLDAADTAKNDPSLCPNYQCTSEGLRFIADAETQATGSTAALIAGGVLAAGGIALVTISVVDRGGFANVAFTPRAVVGTGLVALELWGSW